MLAASGISEAMLRVARRIGFEAFMAMWGELDGNEELLDDRRRLHIPQMEATLLKLQRIQIVQKLGARGLTPGEIIRSLPPSLQCRISRRSVLRILTGK